KLQEVVPDSIPFPCSLKNGRSPKKPKSVHKLKPGDVDVIGAIGDSLTVGSGLTSTNILEILLEERGKSFTIGGERSWREYLTLPNILKMFNPNLIGYSLKTSLSIERESQFNVAEVGALSEHMPYMTKVLIHRIRSDRRVNFNEDWKMVTMYIGSNDFCSNICYLENPEASLERHKNDLIEVLRLFRDNLPRTIVNLIPLAHLQILVNLKVKPSCDIYHRVECPCLFGLPFESRKSLLYDLMNRWQKIDVEVGDNPEFDLDDFTVVVQPFTLNFTFPTASGGREIDHSYLAEDCFHFSQKFNAKVANDLWNNIMEPVGRKSRDGNDLFKKFNCPTDARPYIFTKRNS
ncbi:phospholipase B1, membrane-associated, partial [Asbolus verrucosus]